MSETIFLEKCQTYIDCHSQPPKDILKRRVDQLPAVTISRLTGAGGITIANLLATWLQENTPKANCPWTVFHKNLIQRVLEEHNLPARLAQFMPEDRVSGIADAMEEAFGLHPPSRKLIGQITETTLRLAALGNVILVGRGANVITRHLAHVFHVRFVGCVESRVERVMDYYKMARAEARAFVSKEDAGRRRYLKKYFDRNIDDPLLYHLTINTDLVSPDRACEMIGLQVVKMVKQSP